ncbi:hypothetical protein LIER_29792 [Lithospermum erythrorhizon]|uniref:Retrotransposon gag domain-containing protein n=1 Tax=Lithospermum erythrorhizon TaxID=34254 RepID=A0AAV3RRA4_LITER
MPFSDRLDAFQLPPGFKLSYLTGRARDWYIDLPLKMIDTYQQTADTFVAKFGTTVQKRMPLRVFVAEVFAQMRDRQLLPVLRRMRGNPGKRDQNCYCEYHKEQGHNTNECRILRMEIEKLI